ncbi:hypothetical protein [Streptomyces hiroshimensis]|uniref:Uncharacterized protein n=2 Tax=Streptomyces hiroshimensis TaxID=66424 RepID=A0ABQ2Y6H9_9ACTN|nr:hypothetical protein GCM10010324_10440 [Streptomyces hiroshimensis]
MSGAFCFAVLPRELSEEERDRILDEARHTADPLHLMHLFAISAHTAVACTRAAHPEHFATDPTRA